MCFGTVYARGKVYVFMVIEYDVESTSSDRRVKSSNPKYLKKHFSPFFPYSTATLSMNDDDDK